MVFTIYNTSIQNNKTNVNHNINRYSNNGGGTSTMARKHSSKFSKISSNKSFSLNGYNNHNYIGNQNTFISHDPFSSSNNCTKHIDNNYSLNTKSVSTKNTKGIINQKLRCSPVYSLQCYKNVNQELIEKFENDGGNPGDGINKHFINGNKDHDIRKKIYQVVVLIEEIILMIYLIILEQIAAINIIIIIIH